jgi:hypothetical protein
MGPDGVVLDSLMKRGATPAGAIGLLSHLSEPVKTRITTQLAGGRSDAPAELCFCVRA